MSTSQSNPSGNPPREDPFEFWPYDLRSLGKILRESGKKGFLAKFPAPFLVLIQGPKGGSDYVGPRTEFSKSSGEVSEEELLGQHVIPVVKTARNFYTSKVTIGRAKNNDIIIREPKISKLHAAILIEPDGFCLKDMGSANGTSQNGEPLEKYHIQPLKGGDILAFWRYVFEFQLPEAVTALLGRL